MGQNYGAEFEDLFSKLCRLNGIAVTRIPDGCRQVGKNRLIRVTSPWDWVISYRGKIALIDTKTNQGDTFPNSLIVEHQVRELAQHARSGGLAGYVIWLRKNDRVFFVNALILERHAEKVGSIHETDPGLIFLGRIVDTDFTRIFTSSSKFF